MAFSQKTLDFLMENSLRDDRDWFNEHRQDYLDLVVGPMAEMVEALTPTMLKIDRQFITVPRVDKTISRIHRDMRFYKDKSKYRENCWLTFMREKKLYHGLPSFYFSIDPAGFEYGMGYYQASRESMEIIRGMILAGEPSAKKAMKAEADQKHFTLYGDEYKRPKHPDAPPELQRWLNRKSIGLSCGSNDMELLFSPGLPEIIAGHFMLLAPIYDFFAAAEARKPKEEKV